MSEETKSEPTNAPAPASEGDADAAPLADAAIADLQGAAEEAPASPRAAPGYPLAFRHLSRPAKALRVAVIVALTVHLGAMFLGGAITPVRKFFSPIIGFYAEGLRMSNSWGMFGKPPGSTNVWIQAVLEDGTVRTISTTDAHGRTTWERIRDVRVRKILGKLADEGDRARLGPPFMDFFCRDAKAHLGDVREIRVLNVIHELKDDEGKVTRTQSSPIVYTRPCRAVKGPPARMPIPPPKTDSGGGDL